MNQVVSASRDKRRANWGLAVVGAIVAGLILMALVAACGSSPTEAPAIDGATLLETRCSTCHSTDRATQLTKTSDEWEQTVTRMIGNGAQLTDAEKVVLVDYLTEAYGQ
jgi:cytochrome c2